MKQMISLILAFAILLSLCACGGSAEAEKTASETTAPAEIPETESTDGIPMDLGNRILRNCSNSPFNAFGTRYAPGDITVIKFLDSFNSIAGIGGNDVSRDNDLSVLAIVVEENEEVILYLGAIGGVIAPEDCSRMFADYTNLKTIDFGGCFDTSNVTNMSGMFSNCEKLETLDLSCFDTSAVQDMSYMFNGCSSLKEVNLSSFETGKLQLANHMFYLADQITNVEIPRLDTSRVEDFAEFMAAGGTVNGQPWKSLFSAPDASGPLYGEMFFTLDSQELIESIVTRLAAEFDIFYELTLMQSIQNGVSYTLVPTAENTYEVPELEIRIVPVEGGEDIQQVIVSSRENAITDEGKVGFHSIIEIYYALIGKSRQEMIDNPPSLAQIATSPTLIMEARQEGLVCDIVIFSDGIIAYMVPEGSIIE